MFCTNIKSPPSIKYQGVNSSVIMRKTAFPERKPNKKVNINSHTYLNHDKSLTNFLKKNTVTADFIITCFTLHTPVSFAYYKQKLYYNFFSTN